MLRNARNLKISQNFLTSSSLIKRIVRLSSIGKTDVVVEIGAGRGHITRELCKVCKKVIAIEYDTLLFDKLCDQQNKLPNAMLVCRDFLQWDLPKTNYKVFANIPFNHTTDIIKKLLFARNPPREAWLIVEKGAAQRFIGSPGESVMSLLIKPFFDMKVIYHFHKDDFHPAPSVDAVLLHFAKKQAPDIQPNDYFLYSKFITDCMRHRNHGIRQYLTKKQISTALRLEKLSSDITGGEILYIQWLCLFRCFLRFKN